VPPPRGAGMSKFEGFITGPFAEWISRTLWSVSSSISKGQTPATRLTQDYKREAKGIPTKSPVDSRWNIITRRHFRSLPKLFGLNERDPIAQARRADTQRQQAAALKAWKASDKPEWLDENFYREKVQPRVAGIAIPVLMSALRISYKCPRW